LNEHKRWTPLKLFYTCKMVFSRGAISIFAFAKMTTMILKYDYTINKNYIIT